MAPNLFILAQTAAKPRRWFKSPEQPVSLSRTEVWSKPVPGVYKHTPPYGWTLIATREGSEYRELEVPRKVVYCKCLHRYLFEDDLQSRKRQGFYLSRPSQKEPLTFFCLDDGKTWIQAFDSEDNFIPGPYERFVLDAGTGKFRPMLKGDDPERQARRTSGSSMSSAVSSLHCSSGPNSTTVSRQNSFEQPAKSRSRPASGNSLQVPDAEKSRIDGRPSSSRNSSRARPVREEELPRISINDSTR